MMYPRDAPAPGFSIGICASDRATGLTELLRFLLGESYGLGFRLERILVVASGCPESVLVPVRDLARREARISVVEEPRRRGKANAINRILANSSGKYLVMVNADAFPSHGSIRALLETVSGPKVGAVSAQPVLEKGTGLLQRCLLLMWSSHSLMSLRLNHAGISNHGCDELMVFRRELVSSLPEDVVNDGAYIGGLVRTRGFSVKFSTAARVTISVPKSLVDLIRQRRRIIFGHLQVWKKLGSPPKTIETMLFLDPMSSLKTVVRILSEKPRLIAAAPVILAGESVSGLLGVLDTLRATKRHTVWRRNAE